MDEAERILDRAAAHPVAPDWRARIFELAEALFQSIRMQLSVPRSAASLHVPNGNPSNAPAIRCYQRCGFIVYGLSPEEIRVGEAYHDELLMFRRV